MSAEKIIKIALGEVGYLEKASNSQLQDKTANAGDNNYTKYGAWYGMNGQPWCDMFVSWCADQAGEGSAVGRYAYVPSHKSFFEGKGRWHEKSGYTPEAGDVIIFRNESHIGLVEYVSGDYVHTIEGNTSGGSTLVANGGGVHQKCYHKSSSYILGYGHPAYRQEAKYTVGWHQDNKGWWYADTGNSYVKGWKEIDGKWYWFDSEGYMAANRWIEGNTTSYYVGGDGAMVTNKEVKIGADGGITVAGDWYQTIEETPDYYRETLAKLKAKGILKGTDEAGTLDMPESAVRCLVMLDRAGMFGE